MAAAPATTPGTGHCRERQLVLDRLDARWCACAILPLSIGAFPFGLAYGVTVVESSMNDLVGWLASFIVLAGAAQLAISDLIDQGAPWFIVVGTALVINARFMMYSGALAPSFSAVPQALADPAGALHDRPGHGHLVALRRGRARPAQAHRLLPRSRRQLRGGVVDRHHHRASSSARPSRRSSRSASRRR